MNTNPKPANGVFPVQGDCPLCRAGLKPKVLVPVRDPSGKALMMSLSQTAYDKLKKLAEEHEPLSTELCLLGREDSEQ